MQLTLSGTITDVAGNQLDGYWTNPDSIASTGTSTYPSGDSTPGDNFVFRFTILPGDANQDLVVDIADYNIFRPVYDQQTGPFKFTRGDFDGDGDVDGPGDYNTHLRPNFLQIWVYWDVEYVLGSMDIDQDVDFDDVAPFVLAFNDPAAYMAQYGVDPNLIGDWDGDGDLDFDDIDEFVAWLTNSLIPTELP